MLPIALSIRILFSYTMKYKLSCHHDNINVTIYLKICNLYFLSVDLEVDLRVNALFLQELLEWHYVPMHIGALFGFWESHGKIPFPKCM